MTRPLAFLSPSSLDTLLSMALRIAARAIDSGDDMGMNKYRPGTPRSIVNLLEEYTARKDRPCQ